MAAFTAEFMLNITLRGIPMSKPLIDIIEQFGKDRYWQPGWSKELAKRIVKWVKSEQNEWICSHSKKRYEQTFK